MARPTALALSCAMALATAPAAAAPPRLTDLGEHNFAQAVSDDGTVVVGILEDFMGGDSGVSRWTETTGTHLIGGLNAGRPSISADGGTIAATTMGDVPEAAFWTEADGWQRIGAMDLLPPFPGWGTHSNAISANGQRLAGGTVAPPLEFERLRAFSFNPDDWDDRWADFGWQELPLLRKGSFTEATGISDDGLTQVGRSTTGISSAFRAVIWEDGRIRELPGYDDDHLGGESVSCNRDCSVIVGGGGGNSAFQPVLAWRYSQDDRRPACHFQPHAAAPRMALRYYAYDTSDDGDVVAGGYYYDEALPDGWVRNTAKGFLWIGNDLGGTMHDLQTYLSGLGQHGLDDWPELIVTGVSGNGRHLVGWGIDGNDSIRGWRVDFGTTPRATGGVEDRTRCPLSAKPPAKGVAATAQPMEDRGVPSGRYGDAAGARYFVHAEGGRLLAGTDRRRLAPLVRLGGERYMAPAHGIVTVVRDRRGDVIGLEQWRPGSNQRQLLEHIGD